MAEQPPRFTAAEPEANMAATRLVTVRRSLDPVQVGYLQMDPMPMSSPGPPSPEFFRERERQRLRALVQGDLDLARSLHSDDYQLITPGGAMISREAYLDGIATGDLDYRVFEAASEIDVRVYDRAAAVRYQARIEILVTGQLDSGLFWHTDIHELRDGLWQAVWSHATRIRADPSA